MIRLHPYVPTCCRIGTPAAELHVWSCAGPGLVPSAIFQNGRKCSLVNVAGAAFQRPMSAPGVGVERAETPVRVQGPNIIGVDGNVLAMKGINWFGFDVRGQSVDSVHEHPSLLCSLEPVSTQILLCNTCTACIASVFAGMLCYI